MQRVGTIQSGWIVNSWLVGRSFSYQPTEESGGMILGEKKNYIAFIRLAVNGPIESRGNQTI